MDWNDISQNCYTGPKQAFFFIGDELPSLSRERHPRLQPVLDITGLALAPHQAVDLRADQPSVGGALIIAAAAKAVFPNATTPIRAEPSSTSPKAPTLVVRPLPSPRRRQAPALTRHPGAKR